MRNTAIVAITAAICNAAVVTSPKDSACKNAGMAPAAISGFVGEGRKLNARMKICCITPATINKLIPEPKPHLLITSSMNIISSPPSISWKIRMSSNCP